MQPDFSRLYAQLNLTPDCGLEELKRAYRRRIAELHPDRPCSTDVGDRLTISLPDLNSIYSQALRFHRSHGQLPGARAPETTIGTEPGARTHAAFTVDDPSLQLQEEKSRSSTWKGAILLTLCMILTMIWVAGSPSPAEFSETVETPSLGVQEKVENPRRQHVLHTLEVGMSTETVRNILGEPVTIRGDEWDYGPSWIRFEKGKLAQWHSSPLKPLVVTIKPEPGTASAQ